MRTPGWARVRTATSASSVPQIAQMTKTASDVLIETNHAWGVEVAFGHPGDGIHGASSHP